MDSSSESRRHRVRTAGLDESCSQRFVVRVEKENRGPDTAPEKPLHCLVEIVGRHTAAGVDDAGHPGMVTFDDPHSIDDVDDERRRQIVDHEIAEVFEHVGGLGPSGTRHAGNDHNSGVDLGSLVHPVNGSPVPR